MPAGPSEVMVIMDEEAEPRFVAADLLSQAEHGIDSQVVLLAVKVTDEKIKAVQQELKKQAETLPRVDIIRQSLNKSFVISFNHMSDALDFANNYAPEHLIMNVKEASRYVDEIKNAGAVFLGPYSPESCGDYASGPNHTLPTYGYATMHSGVGVDTFIKYITTQALTKEGMKGISEAVMTLADVEGLQGHKNAVKVRLEE